MTLREYALNIRIRCRKGLDMKMHLQNRVDRVYNCTAALDFGWSGVAVNCGCRGKAHKTWTLGRCKQKTTSARIPLISTTNECSPFMGFFSSIAAVLQTKSSAQVGGVEQTDERNPASVGWARDVFRQGTSEARVKMGYMFGHGADQKGCRGCSFILSRNVVAGQNRSMNGVAGRDNP